MVGELDDLEHLSRSDLEALARKLGIPETRISALTSELLRFQIFAERVRQSISLEAPVTSDRFTVAKRQIEHKIEQERHSNELRKEDAKLQAGALYNAIAPLLTITLGTPLLSYVVDAKDIPGGVLLAIAGVGLLGSYALYAIASQIIRGGWK